MSHFTVTVKLDSNLLAKHDGDYASALDEILAPYNEQPEAGSPYLEFKDEEEEYLKEYETETTTMLKLADGSLDEPYDNKYKNPKYRIFGSGDEPEYVYPTGSEKVQIPKKERYSSFTKFMKEYNDMTRKKAPDGRMRYGHWRNPNAKWDWYGVGGRWTGHYPVKQGVDTVLGESGAFGNQPKKGYADVVRVREIDFDQVLRDQKKDMDEFWTEYQAGLATGKYDDFDGPRSRMLTLGLLRVEQDHNALIAEDEIAGMLWGEQYNHIRGTPRAGYRDVTKKITREQFDKQYAAAFNPLKTYCALDSEGWHAPGEMGWFGCSSDTPESYLAFCNSFVEKFIKSTGPDDLLVCVDCHI